MDRKQFLAGTVGLFAVACVSACKKDENSVAAPSNVNMTVDTADAANAALRTTGGSIRKSGLIIIALGNNNFNAFSQACTHEGTAVDYQANNGIMNCANHGAQFSASTGAVTRGPATSNLKKYTVTVSGTVLTIVG